MEWLPFLLLEKKLNKNLKKQDKKSRVGLRVPITARPFLSANFAFSELLLEKVDRNEEKNTFFQKSMINIWI